MKQTIVLQVCEAFGGGPFASITKTMAETTRHSNGAVQHVLLYGKRPQTPPEDDIRAALPEGTQIISWKAKRFPLHPANALALWQLCCTIRAVKPDVVHAHCSLAGGLCRGLYPFGQLFGLLKTPRVFYSPRAYGFLQSGFLNKAIYYPLEWLLGKLPHYTVPCGAGEAALAEKLTSHKRILRLYNSEDVEAMEATAGDVKPFPEFTVVSAGRISAQKDFPFFCAVAKQCPDLNFLWNGGVGHGQVLPDGMNAEDLPANMRVTGWLSQAETLQNIARGQVFIMTSLYEGLPRNVLEAMAFAKPMVLRNTVGNREMVIHGQDGLVAETPEDFATHLQVLAKDETLRSKLGSAAKAKLKAEYSDAVAVPRYVRVYQGDHAA